MKIHVWPCGAWCYPDEMPEMSHKSDDYRVIELNDGADFEDCQRVADMHAMYVEECERGVHPQLELL